MSLKDDKQQNIQTELDFSSALTGEAREAGREGTESSGAMNGTENPASTNRLMEEVCKRDNLKAALRRGKANKGSPGDRKSTRLNSKQSCISYAVFFLNDTATTEIYTLSLHDALPISNRLMEEVCKRDNLKAALRRVKANKGSPGVDGMTVGGIKDYLKQHWPAIREQLLNGTYEPKPVRRGEIPKPDVGGRKLVIPTVLDRFIQQAVMQVLQRGWDRTFSDHSYGFRPGRSAQQAVAQAQQYIAEGYGWCFDLDLEKFFDRVNHDKLMGQIAKRVEDKRLLKLIRAFLNAGVMENGLVSPSVEGTPQGGPLSPLLSNLVLDEFDRELEQRGHRFVRYADDCNIYVRSERAGQRVMESITQFITQELKLKVNRSEKRRVGKECRSRWSPRRVKKAVT